MHLVFSLYLVMINGLNEYVQNTIIFENSRVERSFILFLRSNSR
jgi:hypothetical protein